MKYPQLVSTRAVNAISDWLVSRLEQLGVEAPQIYSRLLLSLLQSSVQINDPIEFSNLETFFANRKGIYRRYPLCEPNTLKKINAVQCLSEIVSSEQEIAAIETLVDELFEKLIDIENQSTDIEDDDSLMTSCSTNDIRPNSTHHYNKHHKGVARSTVLASKCFVGENKNSKAEGLAKQTLIADNDLDPKKRYYRAFPALTKDMEDSLWVSRNNTKSFTWPIDKIKPTSSGVSSRDSVLGLKKNINNCVRDNVKKQETHEGVATEKLQILKYQDRMQNNNTNNKNNNNSGNIIATVVKRRTRRRRNQALSKTKNIRKNSCGSGNVCVSNNIKSYRSASPYWDTDFEGSWEMGRDLIKEFIVKQNRNRSTSESAAYAKAKHRDHAEENCEMKNMMQLGKAAELVDQEDGSPFIPSVDISFCCNDDDEDTLASVPEILDVSLNSNRRLYKRDVSGSSNEFLAKAVTDDQQDFAQFKAKFDSSLEALWKNTSHVGDHKKEKSKSGAGIHLTYAFNTQTATLEPYKSNLQNFWSHYYNHRFDMSKISNESESIDGNSTSLCCSNSNKNCNAGDFYSMPCNIEDLKKSSHNKCNETPVNIFLQNSIWSEVSNMDAADSDEHFSKQKWNSSKKSFLVNNLNAKINTTSSFPHENMFQLSSQYGKSKWSEGINAGPNPCANNLSVHPARSFLNLQNGESISNITTSSIDKAKPLCDIDSGTSLKMDQYIVDLTNSSPTSVSTTSCSSFSHSGANLNWQTPLLGQSLQPDMQSWSASNPISLTEMYGGEGISSGNECKRFLGKYVKSASVSEEVSLPNHCASTSGFIEYARMKLADVKILRQDSSNSAVTGFPNKPPQQYISRPKERHTADEDLLNSDLTHFRPIKPYEDGHSFYICSSLDVIEYERSQSGYLYWESEKYLEYTRKDSFLAEDETHVNSNQGAPLYGSSNCSNSNKESKERQNNFELKFRIRNCDAVCQTEAECFSGINEDADVEPHPLCLIFSKSMHGMPIQSTGLDCNNAIEALNKAVAAAAKAAAASHEPVGTDHWLNSASNYLPVTSLRSNAINSRACNEMDLQAYDSPSNTLEQWSMRAIGKKCELSNENNSDRHTLWGMCAACNNEFKSVPANRLLKDELQLEADEIMSDLKYMQDLYIGEGGVGDSDSDWDIGETEAEADAEESDNTPNRGDMIISNTHGNHNLSEKYSGGDCNMKGDNLTQTKHAPHDVFNKVNQFITDLLCRESGGERISNAQVPTQVEFFEGLWSFNDKNNIWQQTNMGFKPIDLLKRLNDGQQNAANFRTEDDPFLAQLSWDHDNLAEIWEKKTPAPTEATFVSSSQHADELGYEMENSEVMKRNLKNMLDVSLSPAEISSHSTTVTPYRAAYQRVQEFLSANVSSSPKFKTINRKRRHSASQNFLINSNNNNNNNVKISNLNQFRLKSNNSYKRNEMQNMVASLQAENEFEDDLYSNSEEVASIKQPKQTIITCKYWATIDTDGTPNITNTLKGTAFSCLINKNASILKHVTMVTRPLTR